MAAHLTLLKKIGILLQQKGFNMLKNEKQLPKTYYARHIKEGLVHYLENGKDTLYLVKNDALEKMNKSFKGCPVYVRHVDSVNMDKLREEADGYVVRSFYNEFDGAWWTEMLVVSDEGHEAIKKGWAVSNCYSPTEYGNGGVYHDIDYQKEVKNGVYEHLAIVPNPRYEESVIMTEDEFRKFNEDRKQEIIKLKNSKEKNMLSQEEIDTLVTTVKNSLSEAIPEMVKNAIEAKAEEDKKNAADEDHRKLIREIAALSAKAEGDFSGGLEEKVRTIIGMAEKLGYSKDDAGKNSKENECSEPKKENESEAEEKKEEAKENASEEKAEDKSSEGSEEAKENAAEDDKKEDACGKNEGEEEKKPEEKKENSKGFFSMLKNAKAKSQDGSAVETMARGLALGKQRYGSTK